ncbi:hypothetical protein COCON_G00118150 [Conger conger]|uniref:Uncharacterized protein n=1 Tax=Conger conger TaxID=82655 RepID=A0A9Q1DGB2_CONCO|nr:hypothetical protein COCON_G00118150 [Conger conger]
MQSRPSYEQHGAHSNYRGSTARPSAHRTIRIRLTFAAQRHEPHQESIPSDVNKTDTCALEQGHECL